MDAEAGEDVDEDLSVVARVGRVAVARLVGDLRERAAHLALDRIRGQQRLRVHGVHVVHAVQEGRRDAAFAQRPRDDVEDDGAAEAADVDRPRGRLGVVDDLRPVNRGGKLVGPVHP